jgi:hypothetical protein
MKRGDFSYPRISKAAFRLALPALMWVTVACSGDSGDEAGDSGDDQADAGEVADDPPDAGGDEVTPDAAPACSHCGDIVNMPDEFDPDNLCDGSQPLFDALFACLCGTPEEPGACAEECSDNACAGTDPSDACGNCAAIDCGPETGMCLNDA